MGDMPLVSVIMPAYNAAPFIQAALASALNQTYRSIEVLVIDDGSQDETRQYVEAIARQDARVILLHQENAGVAAARNLGIQHARGEFIAPLDADDIWYPTNLEKQVECMVRSEPSVGVVYSWSVMIDEQGALTGGWICSDAAGEIQAALLVDNAVGNASASLIRRTCLDEVGGYKPQYRAKKAQGCEDWDLYLRIAERYQFQVVPEFLVGYRQTTSSMSSNYEAMHKSHCLMLDDVRERQPHTPADLYRWSTSNYYIYLAYKGAQDGLHRNCLSWALQAAQLDPAILLNYQLIKLLVLSTLKWIAHPISSRIWADHQAWLKFKQKSRSNQFSIDLNTVQENQKNERQHSFRNLYRSLKMKRLQQYRSLHPEV